MVSQIDLLRSSSSDSDDNRHFPLSVETVGDTTIYSGLIHWSYQGKHAVYCFTCLARLFVTSNSQIAILSSLRNVDETRNNGMSYDSLGAINTLIPILRSIVPNFDPLKTIWIGHYGHFTSYDPASEAFWRVDPIGSGDLLTKRPTVPLTAEELDLFLEGNSSPAQSDENEHLMKLSEVQALLNGIVLEDVFRLLDKFGWKDNYSLFETFVAE
jgi:hypothetical protein